jgi:hypothetical protein
MRFTIELSIAIAERHLEIAERTSDRWIITRAITLLRRLQKEHRRRNLMLEPVKPHEPTLNELVACAREIARLADRIGAHDRAQQTRLALLELLRVNQRLATADELAALTQH